MKYTPDQLSFTVKTEHTIYRTWWGAGSPDIVIKADLSLGPNSPRVVAGDEIYRTTANPNIAGFFVATVPTSQTSICGTLSCSFTKNSSTSPVVAASHTLPPLSANAALGSSGRWPGGDVQIKNYWVFAVIDVTGADVPYTNNSAPITIEVYKDEAAFNAAAALSGLPPARFAEFRAEGTGVPYTSSAAAGESLGGEIADTLTGTLLSVINGILTLIIGLLRWILFAIATFIVMPILEVTLSMDASNIASTIQFGWSFVRDLVNMFFILILIVLGFATMLRMESYNYRQILVELVIMAVLVNFSLVIGRIIIQIADIAQFAFLPQGEGMNGVRYLFQVLLNDQTKVAINGLSFSAGGALSASASLIFQFILELGVVITFAALAVYSLIRIIALWVLLILSPFAYALRVLPATQHQAGEWWTYFLKYAFFTPVMAFFLRLTIELHRNGLKITSSTLFTSGASAAAPDIQSYLGNASAGAQVNLASALELIIVYIVVLAFMWAGIMIANKLGIYGADAVTSMAKKGLGAPFAVAGRGAWGATKGLGGLVKRAYSGFVGSKIGDYSLGGTLAEARYKKAMQKGDEAGIAEALKEKRKFAAKSAIARTASLLDPHVLKAAWEKRKHEKEMRDYDPAIGHMQDTFNRIIPTEWLNKKRYDARQLGKKTYHGLVAKRGVVSTEADELLKGVRTREDAGRIADEAFNSGDKDEIEAALKVLQHGNWQDDYMNLRGKKFSVLGYLDDVTQRMTAAGFTEEEQTMILDDLKETGEAAGRIRAYGYTREDDDGKIRAANDLGYYETRDKKTLVSKMSEIQERFQSQFTATGDVEYQDVSNKMQEQIAKIAGASTDEDAQKLFKAALDEGYYNKDNEAQYDDSFEIDKDGNKKSDKTIRNVMIARRFMDEAHIKLRRGTASNHARNIEAAILNDQDPEKGWANMNLLGSMLSHEIGPNIMASINSRIHESQGRLLQGFGALQDSSTGKWALPDAEIAEKSDADLKKDATVVDSATGASVVDENKLKFATDQRDQHLRGLKKILKTVRNRTETFEALTGDTRLFTEEDGDIFRKKFQAYIEKKGIKIPGDTVLNPVPRGNQGQPLKREQGTGAADEPQAAPGQPPIAPGTGQTGALNPRRNVGFAPPQAAPPPPPPPAGAGAPTAGSHVGITNARGPVIGANPSAGVSGGTARGAIMSQTTVNTGSASQAQNQPVRPEMMEQTTIINEGGKTIEPGTGRTGGLSSKSSRRAGFASGGGGTVVNKATNIENKTENQTINETTNIKQSTTQTTKAEAHFTPPSLSPTGSPGPGISGSAGPGANPAARPDVLPGAGNPAGGPPPKQ